MHVGLTLLFVYSFPNTVIIDIGGGPEIPSPSTETNTEATALPNADVEKSTAAEAVEARPTHLSPKETPAITTVPDASSITNDSPPRIISNSQIGATVTARKPRSALTAKRNTKPNKFGVKKATNFNFEQAEASAKQETERQAKLGYSDDISNDVKASEDTGGTRTLSSRLMYQQQQQPSGDNAPSSADQTSQSEQDAIEKLGFGMSRLNASSSPQTASSRQKQQEQTHSSYSSRSMNENNDTSSVKEKFGNAKAISSDQYFGRNEYDPAVSAAESARLKQFSGASAISSSQYFGNNNDDHSSGAQQQHQQGTSGEWDILQDQARRFVGQAAADLDAVRDLAENASSKVSPQKVKMQLY